jgi:HK97 family phage portal protein
MKTDFYENLHSRADQIVNETTPDNMEAKATDIGDLIEKPSFTNNATPLSKVSDYLKAATGWVYASATAISDEIGAMDFKLYERKKDKIEEITDSPVLDLIYKANNFTTKFDMLWLTQNYLELAGEAPWYLVRQNNVITDILLLRPDLITVKAGTGNNFIDGYTYTTWDNNGSNEIPLAIEDVIFIKYPSTTNPFRGMGTLQACAKTVDIDNYSEDYNRTFFANSAMPGSVLKTEQKLRPEVMKQLQYNMKKLYKGANNAHKAMILEQGLDWKPMQLSQKDMDFLEQQRFSRDKILGIFRVPKPVLGLTEDVNRANAEATDFIFAKRTIKPKMIRLVEQLNEFLLPQFEGTENQFLTFTDPIPENTELKLKEYDNALKNGYMTRNEVREKIGLESLGKEGDQIYLPANLIPIGEGVMPSGKKIDVPVNYLNARNRKKKEFDKRKSDLEKTVADKLQPIIKNMIEKKKKDDEGKKKSPKK